MISELTKDTSYLLMDQLQRVICEYFGVKKTCEKYNKVWLCLRFALLPKIIFEGTCDGFNFPFPPIFMKI